MGVQYASRVHHCHKYYSNPGLMSFALILTSVNRTTEGAILPDAPSAMQMQAVASKNCQF